MRRLLHFLLFLPLQAVLLFLFAAVELLRPLGRSRTQPTSDPPPGPAAILCSLVIVNWNGRHLLEECLPALEKAVAFSGRDHEIIVVDNGSRDGSVAWLKGSHPQVRVLELPENLGFGEGNNAGVRAASHEIVVLLNNDMIVQEDFLPPLLEGFKDPEVFAVSSQIHFPPEKRREETGNTQARLQAGYLHLAHDPVRDCHYRRHYLPVFWAGGGSSAFRRSRFLELGGFAPIYSPCYLEDTDLSHRAWRRGWKVMLAAHSQVLHKHRSSSSVRFSEEDLNQLIEERKLWYLWRNFEYKTLFLQALLFPAHLTVKMSSSGYLRAWRRLPAILWFRLREPARCYSTGQVLKWCRHPLAYLNRFHSDRDRAGRLPEGRLRILIVSAYLPHLGHHGGAGRVFQLLCRVAQRHQVTLVSFVETARELEEVAQVSPHCRRVETVFRNRFLPVSFFPYEPFEEFNSAEMRETLEELAAEEDFDCVHFEWTQMAQYADLFPHTPRLMTEIEVNYAAHHSQVKVESRPWKKFRKLYNTLQTFYREIEMCGRVERVVCVTNEDRDYLRGYVPDSKLVVVNTGVDTEFFHPNGKPSFERDSLAFIGAFRHDPNVDGMLYFAREIFPRILAERPQVRLYIVGSSPPASILELGRHPNVKVTGYVPELRDYYHRSQVVVVPLRTGVGIRGKILEGWAAGKAMVATPLACQGIRAVHGENILVASDSKEFAAWTLALLRNPQYGERMGRSGRKTALQFYDWSLLGEEMSTVYEQLHAERERR